MDTLSFDLFVSTTTRKAFSDFAYIQTLHNSIEDIMLRRPTLATYGATGILLLMIGKLINGN
jgi:hypothetical protein